MPNSLLKQKKFLSDANLVKKKPTSEAFPSLCNRWVKWRRQSEENLRQKTAKAYGRCREDGGKKLSATVLTYWGAVEQHLLQVASIIVEGQVPRPGVHVLDETCFLEVAQQQAFGSFSVWDRIRQGPRQRLPIQQFHKVKLSAVTKQTWSGSWFIWQQSSTHLKRIKDDGAFNSGPRFKRGSYIM